MSQRMNSPASGSHSLGLLLNLSQGEILRLALASRGHSIASIARGLGVSRPAVSGVVHGHWASARILARLAALLGVPVEAIRGQPLTPVSVAGAGRRVNAGLSESSRQRKGQVIRRRKAA